MSNISNLNKVIIVEGNIGSGKSTLLKVINKNISGLEMIPEPVCEW